MVDALAVKVRPIKLIAVVFVGITFVLLACGVAGKEWVEIKFQHHIHPTVTWGLWEVCILSECSTIPEDWVKVCATFCIISLAFSVSAVLAGVIGLCTVDLGRRRLWYTIAGIFASLVALLSAIIYPVKFKESVINYYVNIQRWDFDWTYGIVWGGIIFSIAAAIFLFLPIDAQELGLS